MRSSGAATSDNFTIFKKQLNGVPARLTAKVIRYKIIIGKSSYQISFPIK